MDGLRVAQLHHCDCDGVLIVFHILTRRLRLLQSFSLFFKYMYVASRIPPLPSGWIQHRYIESQVRTSQELHTLLSGDNTPHGANATVKINSPRPHPELCSRSPNLITAQLIVSMTCCWLSHHQFQAGLSLAGFIKTLSFGHSDFPSE